MLLCSRALGRLAMPSSRLLLSTSASATARRIQVTEQDDVITVEAVPITSPHAKSLLKVPPNPDGCKEGCHPLCKLPFVHEIRHTDVLILSQFVDSTGKMYDRPTIGMCKRQFVRLSKLIKMAQKAGLMGEKDIYRAEKTDPKTPHLHHKTYWVESTIDAQWRRNRKNEYYDQIKR